jgi:hypothetical protein
MKTIKRNQLKLNSKNIVAVKVMAFLSWLIYIGIAFANNMMIEAFIFSVGLVIIGYLIFGRKPSQKAGVPGSIIITRLPKESSPDHNYLSVFFHRTDEAV